jgi:hypothetical protein
MAVGRIGSLPIAALPPSMAVVKPGRSNSQAGASSIIAQPEAWLYPRKSKNIPFLAWLAPAQFNLQNNYPYVAPVKQSYR